MPARPGKSPAAWSLTEVADHLVYTVPDLESGMDKIEELLGVRPVRGGRHPNFGTHNALLSLGRTTYLEIIARDPELKIPDRGLPFDMENLNGSRLATWALRTENISERAATAKLAGLETGAIEFGERQLPDGSVLSWQLTDPRTMLLDGAVPFLISWGESPHPAKSVTCGGQLIGFRLEHPQPDRVHKAFSALGIRVDTSKADSYRLVACVRTGSGNVELR